MQVMNMRFLAPALLVVAAALMLGTGPARADVACGPNAVTYQVGGSADPDGSLGVRCLRFVDGGSFVWYGEGRHGAAAYRHLGYAAWSGSPRPGALDFQGWAGDIAGNGEIDGGSHPGDLTLSFAGGEGWTPEAGPPKSIAVSGAWQETWTLVDDVAGLDPLPPVRKCGPNFRQYAVSGAGPDDTVRARRAAFSVAASGVRCLFDADGKFPAAWLGEGRRGGAPYRELGAAWFGALGPAWGTSDLCMAGFTACDRTAFGELRLERFDHEDVYRVEGDHAEWWDRARR
jgi:hypothetical protein